MTKGKERLSFCWHYFTTILLSRIFFSCPIGKFVLLKGKIEVTEYTGFVIIERSEHQTVCVEVCEGK